MFNLGAYAEAIKLIGLALLVGGATWWLLSTVSKAQEADRLATTLALERAERKAEAQFALQVSNLASAVDGRMVAYLQTSAEQGQALREELIRATPANSPCFSHATVRLLRRGRDGAPAVPGVARDAPRPITPAAAGTP